VATNKTDSASKAKAGSAKALGKTGKSWQTELPFTADVLTAAPLSPEAAPNHEVPADIQSWLADAQSAWEKKQAEEERLALEEESGARVIYVADAAMAGDTMPDTGNMLLAQNTVAPTIEEETERKAVLLPQDDGTQFHPAWLGLGLLGLGGGGGGGGGGIVGAINNIVNGSVVLGPVVAGHELTVNVYAADGVTLLGSGAVSANGTFSVDVGSYTGVVIA
jgi:hypothetical protein